MRFFGGGRQDSDRHRGEVQRHRRADDPTIREGVKQYANWPTIPQLYIKGEFIGGCDIVREMAASGELQTLLKDKGVVA